jgi:hypothetical protein
MKRRKRTIALLGLLLTAIVVCSACGNKVDPYKIFTTTEKTDATRRTTAVPPTPLVSFSVNSVTLFRRVGNNYALEAAMGDMNSLTAFAACINPDGWEKMGENDWLKVDPATPGDYVVVARGSEGRAAVLHLYSDPETVNESPKGGGVSLALAVKDFPEDYAPSADNALQFTRYYVSNALYQGLVALFSQ